MVDCHNHWGRILSPGYQTSPPVELIGFSLLVSGMNPLFCFVFFLFPPLPRVISFTSHEAVIQSPDGGFDNRVLVVGLPPAD